MSQLSRFPAALVPALMGLLIAGAAVAQPAPEQQGREGPPGEAGQPPGAEGASPGASEEALTAEHFPVFTVTSIEVVRSAHSPVLDVVIARGMVSSEGWSSGTLVPLTHGSPIDGVLDLVFVGEAPSESAAPTSFAPFQAVLPISPDHPFKAVRVRSATNTLTLKQLPGYVEAKVPSEACNKCVGKHFVAKGKSAPSGTQEVEIVHEEDLPANVRVVAPGDGIGDMRTNPNRLTIVISEDGRIVDAVWE